MKVVRFTTLLDFGGQEKKYISFTDFPELLHNDYIFVALGYGGNAEMLLRERGFKVYILNRKYSIRNISNIWTVYKLLKKIRPDVVHTAAAEANFHGIIAAKLAGVKCIVGEEIGIPKHSSIARRIFALVYKMANKVICVSQSVKDHLVGIGEISNKKGVVVYNPVSVPTVFPKKIKSKLTIVYVGRLEKVKNVETLIRAFSLLSVSNACLQLVGEGRERKNLEDLVKSLNLKNSVEFKGFQSDPSKVLCSADLFVLPSYSEGFGIAAVEAMFLKVRVLCSRVGGIPEFVTDGKSGWLFNPHSVEELASKLNQILSMADEKRREIGIRGFEGVRNKFTVEKYVENLEKLYKNIT